jgi:hypothetical protein
MVPAMPVAVPVVMTANAARSPIGPHNPAVWVIVIGIVVVIVRIIAADEEVPTVEVRNAEAAAVPAAATVPTSATAAMATAAAANFSGQSLR